jgi:hypothetical protein
MQIESFTYVIDCPLSDKWEKKLGHLFELTSSADNCDRCVPFVKMHVRSEATLIAATALKCE